MTVTSKPITHQDGGEETLWQLRRSRRELAAALQQLIDFQKESQALKSAATVDEALDQMERLLERIVTFSYARLFLRDNNGALAKVRELCPEEFKLDMLLVEWVAKSQETAIIPLEERDGGDLLQSLLLLPFCGNSGAVGVLALWLAQNPSSFTQREHALLSALSRETATALEAIDYRARIDKGRTMMLDVIESVPHGLLALDSDGRVSMINGTMEITLGVARDKVVGNPYPVVLPLVMVRAIEPLGARTSREEREFSIAIGGEERHLGLSVTPIHEASRTGDSYGHLIICRDLELSHEIKKLRELDAMKSSFIALVSHELRTPMTAIIGHTESILFGDDELTPEIRQSLQVIQGEGMRLGQLINDVLDLTRMESGQFEFHYEMLDPNELVTSAAANMEHHCAAKHQTLNLDLCDDPGLVNADPERLTQVVNNLLSNANKYTQEGGTITIRTRLVVSPPREGEENTDWLEIAVEDNGAGIAPEHQAKLFDKFTISENIQHHSTGTGLGLVICKQIVKIGHKGNIDIDSELGRGTIVRIHLPLPDTASGAV